MSRESTQAIERTKRLGAMSLTDQRAALAAEKTGIKPMTLQEKLDDEFKKLEESYKSAQAANEYRRCDRLQGAMDTINNLQAWLNAARLSGATNRRTEPRRLKMTSQITTDQKSRSGTPLAPVIC
jgi:hypothetical protein